jgi:hypothetical protein
MERKEKLQFNNENYLKLREDSDRFRGNLIDMMVNIEFFMSDFLSEYFAKKELSDDLNMYVFARELSLESKKNILSNMIANNKINCFYKDFSNDLQYLQILRNKIAHCTLYIAKEYIDSYNRNELIYAIYELKKYEKSVVVRLNTQTENPDKLIYSQESVIARANRVMASFGKAKGII